MSRKLGEIIPQQPQTRNEKYTYDDFVKAFGDFNTFFNASHYRFMQFMKYSQTREEQDIFSIIEKVLSLQKALAPSTNKEGDDELVKDSKMNKQKLEKFVNLQLDLLSIVLSLDDDDLESLIRELEGIINKYKEKAIEYDVIRKFSKLSDEEKKKLIEKIEKLIR